MATRRKQKTEQPDRRAGVSFLSAGAAAIGLGAALIAMLLRQPKGGANGGSLVDATMTAPASGEVASESHAAASAANPAEHAVPDLAPDAPPPGPYSRAPDAFRPDPTAPVPPELRESLRPATGTAPGFAADRGSGF